jgi:hypothetical protein
MACQDLQGTCRNLLNQLAMTRTLQRPRCHPPLPCMIAAAGMADTAEPDCWQQAPSKGHPSGPALKLYWTRPSSSTHAAGSSCLASPCRQCARGPGVAADVAAAASSAAGEHLSQLLEHALQQEHQQQHTFQRLPLRGIRLYLQGLPTTLNNSCSKQVEQACGAAVLTCRSTPCMVC